MTITRVVSVLALSTAALLAEDYKIDGAHSSAHFSVKHLMVSNVRGDIGKVAGTVAFDDKNPAAIRIDATLDAATINTANTQRDEHLRGADFFDTAKYPTITFKSKSARKNGNDLLVTGDLTLHGVTKEVVLTLEGPSPEVKDPWGLYRRGATATTRINRKDFGLTWNKALETGGVMVGEDVNISIDIEAVRPAAKK